MKRRKPGRPPKNKKAKKSDEELNFHDCIAKGNTNMVVKFLNDSDTSANDLDPKTRLPPLFLACDGGFEEIVQILIENKADVNVQVEAHSQTRSLNGATPLHIAVVKGHLACVKQLLLNEADPNVIWQPKLVSEWAHWELLRIWNEYHWLAPLHIAVWLASNSEDKQEIYTKILKLLLKHGADINLYSKAPTPAVLEKLYPSVTSSTVFKYCKSAEIALLLLDNKKLRVDFTDDGRELVRVAIKFGERKILEKLISLNYNINAVKDSDFPLIQALKDSSSLDIVDFLIENGASVLLPADWPPFMAAIEGGDVEKVKHIWQALSPDERNSALSARYEDNVASSNCPINALYLAFRHPNLIKSDKIKIIHFLVSADGGNFSDFKSVVRMALKNGDVETLKWLNEDFKGKVELSRRMKKLMS